MTNAQNHLLFWRKSGTNFTLSILHKKHEFKKVAYILFFWFPFTNFDQIWVKKIGD